MFGWGAHNAWWFGLGIGAMVLLAALWPEGAASSTAIGTGVQAVSLGKQEPVAMRLATYNIHIGKDVEDTLNLDKTIDTLRTVDADVVALQEVERHSLRTGFVDQPKKIAEALGMDYRFGVALKVGLFEFGDVLLSRYPILSAEKIELPSGRETRQALLASLDVHGKTLNVLVTHLGLSAQERSEHVSVLDKRLAALEGPVAVMGDFNCPLEAPELKPWLSWMQNTAKQPLQTFPGLSDQIDGILLSKGHFDIKKTYTVESSASDHVPLVSDVVLKP
jgi:endonuclease/exonuclease/phosphatase family metal-dependent hydrolase